MWSSDCKDGALSIADSAAAEDTVPGQPSKEEFLAMLAHELRNPLASIRNAVEVLRRLNLQEPRAEWAREVVDRQAAQLARMIDDLLDMSRITRGKITLRPVSLNLAVVIVRAVEVNLPLIKARRLKLFIESEPLDIELEGDEVRLTQALANILNNAAKYSYEEGRIWLSVKIESDEAAIRIKDEGIGIAPELLPYIFDLFTQGPRTLDRTQGGLGIGLSLVRSLIGMHGGRVAVSSAGEGQGAEFVVWLPLRRERSPISDRERYDSSATWSRLNFLAT
ncbi:sensor histidine kinase [Methylocaldum szegediense]|uniref:histidine kinase n=1 Tax=Methylocaldum szegediense TaxID=73780 RepID=A0ABM9I7Z1_9GAMM|nr:HAMP domain-containing sensor histidine kinase [Methylocaldum szegediense]CAI8948423.1 Histidine kinase [Methylocaldum szegediense]